MKDYKFINEGNGKFEINIEPGSIEYVIKMDNKVPLSAKNNDGIEIIVYDIVLKFIFTQNDPEIEKVFEIYQLGFLEGFKVTKDAYFKNYIHDNAPLLANLKAFYNENSITKLSLFVTGNENDIWKIGYACGVTSCIDLYAKIYRNDFEWLLSNKDSAILLSENQINQFWLEYNSLFPHNNDLEYKIELIEDFKKRFYTNADFSEKPLIPNYNKKDGRKSDIFKELREWRDKKFYPELYEEIKGSVKRFDNYTKRAFGTSYRKKR